MGSVVRQIWYPFKGDHTQNGAFGQLYGVEKGTDSTVNSAPANAENEVEKNVKMWYDGEMNKLFGILATVGGMFFLLGYMSVAQPLGPEGDPVCGAAYERAFKICGTTSGTQIYDHKGDTYFDIGSNEIPSGEVVCVAKLFSKCDDLSAEASQAAKELQKELREESKRIAAVLAQIEVLTNEVNSINEQIVRVLETTNGDPLTDDKKALENLLIKERDAVTARIYDLEREVLKIEDRINQLEENGAVMGDAELGGTEPDVYAPDIPSFPNLDEFSKKPIVDGPGLEGGSDRVRRFIDDGVFKGQNLIPLVLGWLRFVFPFVAVLAVVAIMYAGFLLIFYYGDEEKTSTAKNIVLYVVAGIILVFLAFAIVNTIINAFNI